MTKVPNQTKKILFFACVGHFLELYDYTAYVVMLSIISPLFFPAASQDASLNIGMILFAASLLIGPIGAWFWGHYGDRQGRLPLLRRSIMLMALPSLVIACLPVYQEIGIISPIILVLARLVQTFSASGEVNGSKIFAMEHLSRDHQGKISGILSAAGALGVLFAMAMATILVKYELSWRLPFFIGSSLALVGIFLRRKVAESTEFKELLSKVKKETLPATNTLTMLKQQKPQVIIVVVMAAMLGVLSYMMHGFMSQFLVQLGQSKSTAYQMSTLALASCGVFSIITGIVVDYKKTSSPIMKGLFLACIVLVPFSFYLIINGNEALLQLAMIILGMLLGISATTSAVVQYRLFTPADRCRGVMISYSWGMAIFGGLTPITLKLLTNYSNYMPAIAVAMIAGVVYLIYSFYMKKVQNEIMH